MRIRAAACRAGETLRAGVGDTCIRLSTSRAESDASPQSGQRCAYARTLGRRREDLCESPGELHDVDLNLPRAQTTVNQVQEPLAEVALEQSPLLRRRATGLGAGRSRGRGRDRSPRVLPRARPVARSWHGRAPRQADPSRPLPLDRQDRRPRIPRAGARPRTSSRRGSLARCRPLHLKRGTLGQILRQDQVHRVCLERSCDPLQKLESLPPLRRRARS